MKYITHNDSEIETDETSLQGNIGAGYSLLCKLFGQPHASDGHKSDAGWDIEFEDGTIATIYNWKNGKNYCGSDGYDTQKITSWNVGGYDINVFHRIKRMVDVAEDEEHKARTGGWPEGYESFCIEEVGHTWNPNN